MIANHTSFIYCPFHTRGVSSVHGWQIYSRARHINLAIFCCH